MKYITMEKTQFTDPKKFRPERWLRENNKAFTDFTDGRRIAEMNTRYLCCIFVLKFSVNTGSSGIMNRWNILRESLRFQLVHFSTV